MKDAVRDSRPQFVLIDYAALERLPEVGATAFAVYIALVKCAAHDSRQCFPARSTLAKTAGISLRSVDSSVVKLRDAGLIAVSRRVVDGRDTSSLYTILTVAHRSADSAPSPVQILPPPPANSAHRTRSNELDPVQPDPTSTSKSKAPLPPTLPAGKPADQDETRTVPTRAQANASPSRSQRSSKSDQAASPAGDDPAPKGRWHGVATAIAQAIGRPGPRGKMPTWLGNTVAAFGAAAGDDPERAADLVEAWSRSKALRDALDPRFFRDRDLASNAGAWIATSGRTMAAGRQATPVDRECARMQRLGAPDNWRDIVYAPGGVKRSPVLALPRMGLEPYAHQGEWPAWYRAFEGAQS